ncbi:hypothetical protein GCM10009592_26390 [Brachybacterium rhamnosum]|uniref:Uncharacterized protein n=1 Tax=Brachybacterium rhamnosum TaxID=173361 RepID=A0ABW4Q1B1_9MICO
MNGWPQRLLDVTSTYEGLASWIVAVIAVLTGITAILSLVQAKALRFEEARPYVVAGLRRVTPTAVELYIKNYGRTAAYQITVDSAPPLWSLTFPKRFRPPQELPMLAPGDEWSTIWETKAGNRKGLPDRANRFEVKLQYRARVGSKFNGGPRYRPISDSIVIDFQPYLSTTFVDVRPYGDIVKSIEKATTQLRAIAIVGKESPPEANSGRFEWLKKLLSRTK